MIEKQKVAELMAAYLTQADVATFIDPETRVQPPRGYTDYNFFRKTHFDPVVDSILLHLLKAGKLGVIAGTQGREMVLSGIWNEMVTMPDTVNIPRTAVDWYENPVLRVSGHIGHQLMFRPIYDAEEAVKGGADVQEAAKVAILGLVDQLAAGNLDPYTPPEDYDFVTDERYQFFMTNWAPAPARYDREMRDYVALCDIKDLPLASFQVNFSTGNLIIADWFRIEGFISNSFDGQQSVNSYMGREATTRHFAEHHNIVHISVGNTSPGVFQDPHSGELVIGDQPFDIDEQDEPDGTAQLNFIGRTCTDLWWVTVIEREHLINIIAQGADITPDEAEARVEEYASSTVGVTELKVPPGVKTIYFSGNHERFGRDFKSPDLATDLIEPVFVIANRDLELTLDNGDAKAQSEADQFPSP